MRPERRHLEEARQFLGEHPVECARQATAQTLERMTQDVALRERLGAARPCATLRGMPRRARVVALTLCLLALASLCAAHAAIFWHYVNDDAYITFRYSRSLASGQGPYFNPGEHVEGYTNFLLMVMAAAAIAAAGPDAAAPFAKGLGMASGAGAAVLAWLLVKKALESDRHGGTPSVLPAFAAVGLVVCAPDYAINSVSGLETALYALFLAAGVALAMTPASPGRGLLGSLVFGCAALTRPEGALLFTVVWLVRALVVVADRKEGGRLAATLARPWREPVARSLLIEGAVFTAVFTAHLLFRMHFYDGEWLPNTYYAKLGGFGKVSPWTYAAAGVLAPFGGAVGVVLALAGWAVRPRLGSSALVLLAAATTAAAEPFWAGVDWMLGHRLVAPSLPLVAAVVAVGWFRLASRVVARPRLAGAVLVGLLPVAWWFQQSQRRALFDESELRAVGYVTGHRALAEWVGSAAAPGETVALLDIGIVGFLCPQLRILDTSGLTDRRIAKSEGNFLDKRYDIDYVLSQRPRYIVLILAWSGRAYEPPTPGAVFQEPVRIEASIAGSPEFAAWYRSPRPPGPNDRWPRDLAASIGAERVFEHAYQGMHYLLAAFRRHDAPGPSGVAAGGGHDRGRRRELRSPPIPSRSRRGEPGSSRGCTAGRRAR